LVNIVNNGHTVQVNYPVLPNTGGAGLQADETLIALGTLLIIGGLGLSALNRERAA
jgi:hypothetical protein